jgi:predicted small metal-binding protein
LLASLRHRLAAVDRKSPTPQANEESLGQSRTITDARILSGFENLGRWRNMKMHWACSMGHPVTADNEAELVRKAQEHMKKEHGMNISREEVMRQAKRQD